MSVALHLLVHAELGVRVELDRDIRSFQALFLGYGMLEGTVLLLVCGHYLLTIIASHHDPLYRRARFSLSRLLSHASGALKFYPDK